VPLLHDAINVDLLDGDVRPRRRAQIVFDPPVQRGDESPHGLLRLQLAGGLLEPLELAGQLQRRRQQRFVGQALAAQIVPDPPELVFALAAVGQRLARARQVVEVAALLRQPDLLFDQ
jgi:hypothetical protein